MAKSNEISLQQRAEIVMALLRREEPAAVLAKRYGISDKTLYRWRDEFINAGTTGISSTKANVRADAKRIAELEKEVEERDRVIGELTIANRILKKTLES